MRAMSTCSVSRWLCILSVSLAWMLCVSANASAQTPPPPVATASQSFGFDYRDTDVVAGAVVRFEMQVDAAAFVSVAMPPKANDAQTPAGFSTYKTPIPALTTGSHTVSFRACSTALCSAGSPPLTFILAVQPAVPSGTRILGGN